MRETDWQDRQEEREFEAALTRSLRRVDAPEGFAALVMARAEAEQRTAAAAQAATTERAPWWRLSAGWKLGWKPAWGGLAALLVAGVLCGHVVHERRAQEQARAEASQQFDRSVQITERALDHAREQLQRAGVTLDPDGQ